MDGSPFMTTQRLKSVFNGGWCYGGFKATLRADSVMPIYWQRASHMRLLQLTNWIDLGAALLSMRRALALNQTYTKEDVK